MTHLLVLALDKRAEVRVQLPFAASEISEPEPDVAVVPVGGHDRAHPEQAMLLIEVSESSLSKDRRVKARIYAQAGVPEYWVIDVGAQTIEVRSKPQAGQGQYAQLRVARPGEAIRLQAFPDVELAVADVVR